MKFSFSWLKEHLDTQLNAIEISEKLTSIGLEVESFNDASLAFRDFIVAEVIEEKKHPNADKLKLCLVDTGKEKVDVVCGAPNVEKGMKVVYAPPGSIIPVNQMKLKVSKIRGVESQGMMCSEYELGISDEHDGIIRLDDSVKVGSSYAEISGMNDTFFEIGITPNRQDCLGVSGISRDLSASKSGNYLSKEFSKIDGSFDSPVDVKIEDQVMCPAFASRYIKNVKNCESPDWLKSKLKSIGLRPISALVDITNYVMYDQNRPLHVYDADKINKNIIVRSAKDKETLKALDEKEYALSKGMCVIADDMSPLGLGGIMGGESTGCSENTTNVLLESALFDPINTAKTGRKLSILSDARYRFERGIDPLSVIRGIDQASQLISEICGGEFSHTVVSGSIDDTKKSFEISVNKINKRLGLSIEKSEVIEILSSLGIECKEAGEKINCVIPTWRQDIDCEADISEEIIRIKGYDFIPQSNIRSSKKINESILNYRQKNLSKAKRYIASLGYNELVTYSFANSKDCNFFGNIDNLRIVNPISEDQDILRPSLIPNLLNAIKKNQSRDIENFEIFEAGSQYTSSTPGDQFNSVVGLKSGINKKKSWRHAEQQYDVYDIKNDIVNLIDYLIPNQKKITLDDESPEWMHPGRSASIILNKKIRLGYFGELHPRVIKSFKIKNKVNAFELLIDQMPESARKLNSKVDINLSEFQSVKRDFAFVVDQHIRALDLEESAKKVDKDLIRDVEIFDIFEDESLGPNKKSMAIKVTIQASDRTLKDNEIQDICSKIVKSIEKSTSGSVRS